MISATYRKCGIRLRHVWFADYNDIPSTTKGADLVYIHGIHQLSMPNAIHFGYQNTLIKKLSNNEENVYQSFGKHLRKFIQRSINEGTTVCVFSENEITSQILNTCEKLYNKMKADKQISGEFNMRLAKKYASDGNLWISMAFIKETAVGFKASIVDESHLRGWVSAFAFREEEADAQAVSRAHQLLEWETMRYCCKCGVTYYDFGGIYSFDEPNGIDKFKMNLAKDGERVTYSNYLVGASIFGKMAIWAYSLLKKKGK